jgi:DnaJ-class molecular chaperone
MAKKMKCGNCNGKGKIILAGGWNSSTCIDCRGKGYVEVK